MQLCFATNNRHKLMEVQHMLGDAFRILSLSDIGCHEELPENQETLQGNSAEKAQYVHQHYHVACFADDTGLEVAALQGAPGVYSARYAGPQRDSQDNMQLLLSNLADKADRAAQFRTVVTLILNNEQQHQFEGQVKGTIAQQPTGAEGFGYDPVFVPAGHGQSFAEMPLEEKNKMSHRGRAIAQLVRFLTTQTV